MFRDKQTGQYPLSRDQIRTANPGTIYPQDFMEAPGYDYVHPAIVPDYNQDTQVLEQGEVIFDEGIYRLSYNVRDLTAEELEIRNRVVVPPAVTMRQARLALLGAGLLDDIDVAINAMPDTPRRAARIEWDYSNELQRSNPFVANLGTAIGLTSEQIDNLFIQAANL